MKGKKRNNLLEGSGRVPAMLKLFKVKTFLIIQRQYFLYHPYTPLLLAVRVSVPIAAAKSRT